MPEEPRNRTDAVPPSVSPPFSMEDESIDLLTLWRRLRAQKRKILQCGGIGLVLAGGIGFLVPNSYTASATFITPKSGNSGLSAVSAQMTMMGAGNLASTFKNSGDMYIGILQSETVSRDMVTRFNLQNVYRQKKMSAAENELAAHSTFDSGMKNDIIRITVTDHNPALARDMANAYLDELYRANGRLALTEASQRRLFFEQQMSQEKDALENAEVELRKTQEQTGLIAPVPQTALQMQSITSTRESIEAREVELAGMLQGATEQSPQVIRLRSEIADLKSQLARMINGGGSDTSIPTAKVPAIQLEYVRKQREVSYHETLFEILARQYEAARLDESHDAPMLQVVDYAILPDTKSGPHRSLFMLAGLILGLMGSSLWILLHIRFKAQIQRIRKA